MKHKLLESDGARRRDAAPRRRIGIALAIVLGIWISFLPTTEASADRYAAARTAFDFSAFSSYAPTSDGGFIAGGVVFNGALYEAKIGKWDADGVQQWEKRYPSSESFLAGIGYVHESDEHTYLFAGEKDGGMFYGELDAAGELLWSATSHHVSGKAAGLYRSGSSYTAIGASRGDLGQPGKIYVFSVHPTGSGGATISDENNLGDPSGRHQTIYDVVPAADGGWLIVGSIPGGSGISKGYLLKLSPTFDKVWEREYAAPGTSDSYVFLSAYSFPSGDFVVVGSYAVVASAPQDLMLMRMDGDGTPSWLETYAQAGTQVGLTVLPTREGGFLAAGGNNSGAGVLLKTDGAGALQWSKTLDDAGQLRWARQHPDGSYSFAGGWGEGVLIHMKVGAPTGVTMDDAADRLSGLTPAMEYSTDGGVSYTTYDPAEEPLFTGDTEVRVRYKEDLANGYERGEAAVFWFTETPVTIVSVEPLAAIPAGHGTALPDVGLPVEVTVTLSGGQTATAAVAWDGGAPAYDGNEPGTYVFTGTLTPPAGATNPLGLTATATVVVGDVPFVLVGIEPDAAAYRLRVGESHATVVAAVYSDGSRSAILGPVQFVSSAPGVAAVDEEGVVTGRSPGAARITASYQAFETAIEVEVWAPTPSSDDSSGSSSSGSDPARRMTSTQCTGNCTAVFEDLVRIDIPRLPDGTVVHVTIEEVVVPGDMIPSSLQRLSSVFELLRSDGRTFDQPMTLRFKFQAAELRDGWKAALFYFDEAEDVWVEIESRVEEDEVAAEVDHFTKFAVFGVQDLSSAPEAPVDPVEEAPLAADFDDMKGHWAELAVSRAAAAGVVQGYPDGSYRPEQAVTRAQFVSMLMRMLQRERGGPELGGAADYADAAEIEPWASGAIAAARQLRIADGYADGTFRPNALVTRAEAVVMLGRALQLETAGDASSAAFADAGDIPAWAAASASAVQRAGIVQGREDGRFGPADVLTRAEAAALMVRAMEAVE